MDKFGRVIALGFFDGVHLGHGALLNRVNEISEQIHARPSVATFDIHPDLLVFHHNTELITDSDEKRRLLQELYHMEDIIFLRFTSDLMKMDYQLFLDLLISEFDVRHIVVGHDFTFGYKGLGNVQNLQEYCSEHNIGCDIIPPVYFNNIRVSSTYIRTLLADGDISGVQKYLGHPYRISGTVIQGLHNGRKLGFPTLNIKMPHGLIRPRFGVYASRVILDDGRVFFAATDVGVKPTVCDDSDVLIESHLLDFNENLYGRIISVELCEYIRDEIKFSSLEDLVHQISEDVLSVRRFFD